MNAPILATSQATKPTKDRYTFDEAKRLVPASHLSALWTVQQKRGKYIQPTDPAQDPERYISAKDLERINGLSEANATQLAEWFRSKRKTEQAGKILSGEVGSTRQLTAKGLTSTPPTPELRVKPKPLAEQRSEQAAKAAGLSVKQIKQTQEDARDRTIAAEKAAPTNREQDDRLRAVSQGVFEGVYKPISEAAERSGLPGAGVAGKVGGFLAGALASALPEIGRKMNFLVNPAEDADPLDRFLNAADLGFDMGLLDPVSIVKGAIGPLVKTGAKAKAVSGLVKKGVPKKEAIEAVNVVVEAVKDAPPEVVEQVAKARGAKGSTGKKAKGQPQPEPLESGAVPEPSTTPVKEPNLSSKVTQKTGQAEPPVSPGPMLWRTADGDLPVDVEGVLGVGPDGRTYVKVKGSDSGVPLDELLPPESVSPTPETQAAKGLVDETPEVAPEPPISPVSEVPPSPAPSPVPETPGATAGAAKPGVPDSLPEPAMEAGAGLNPIKVLRDADRLGFKNSKGGSFEVERAKQKGPTLFDQLVAPLSIPDPVTGKSLQVGAYERLAGEPGKQVSDAFRAAQREIDANVEKWGRSLDEIEAYLGDAFKGVKRKPFQGRTAKESFYGDFVDLVEKEFTDPERLKVLNSDTPLGKALRTHDELTENVRNHIIESRRSMGIETPDDWGITDRGYFRHLFLGDIQIMMDGKFMGTAQTYVEAQKKAADLMQSNPTAKVVARARNTIMGDPTVRLSTKRYWKTVNQLADQVEIPAEELIEDLRGVIGRQAAKQKWFGALLPRKGAPGYSKAYMDVMRVHAAQAARTQALSKLNRAVMPKIEAIRAEAPGLAEMMEDHLSALWGTPNRIDRWFGETVSKTPVLRNYVANPTFAMRSTSRRLTNAQYLLKLKYNVKSSFVNLAQPLTTLWPHISTADFARIYAKSVMPSTRQMLREKGVFTGATKIDRGGVAVRGGKASDPFTAASNQNRAVGYLYGYEDALKKGATEDVAHQAGLSWAERVEFDNSQWNIQPAFRSDLTRMLGQFKSFSGKNLENWANILKRQEGDTRLSRASRIGKATTGQLALGGIKSTPLAILAKLYVEARAAGNSHEEASALTEAVAFGAPGLIGMDISSSVNMTDLAFGNTPEEQLLSIIGGPTVGTGVSLYKGVRDFITAEDGTQKTAAEKRQTVVNRTLRKVTPYYRQGKAAKELYEGDPVTVPGPGKDITLTKQEAIMLALGFTPTKQRKAFDKPKAKPKASPTAGASDLIKF